MLKLINEFISIIKEKLRVYCRGASIFVPRVLGYQF